MKSFTLKTTISVAETIKNIKMSDGDPRISSKKEAEDILKFHRYTLTQDLNSADIERIGLAYRDAEHYLKYGNENLLTDLTKLYNSIRDNGKNLYAKVLTLINKDSKKNVSNNGN